MTATPISIAGTHYRTKTALKDQIKKVLNRHPLEHRIEGEDALLVSALFDRHPDRTTRMEGHAVSHFEVRTTRYPTRSFHVVRTDGVAIDFSASNCI